MPLDLDELIESGEIEVNPVHARRARLIAQWQESPDGAEGCCGLGCVRGRSHGRRRFGLQPALSRARGSCSETDEVATLGPTD